VADPQQARRVGAVAAGRLQGLDDQARLEGAPRAAEREIAARPAALRLHGLQVRREIGERQAVAARQDGGALQDVLELAHVAGPGVAHQAVQGVVVDAADGLAERLPRAPDEVVHEQRDVLAPLPERRDLHAHDVEAVEQVLAEAPGGGLGLEVPGRRRQHAHVHPAGLRLADGADLLLLEHAQQLGLERQRQLADLVEEQRAAVGLGEEPAPRAVGAGERPLGVPEELALEQRLRDRGAVHGDEGVVPARGLRVDGAGEHLLARAALALEEHGRLVLRGALDQLQHLDHRRRGRDDRPLADRALHVALEELVRAAELLPLAGLAQREQDLRGLEGLREVVVGAAPHGLDGEVGGAVSRHQDHGDAGQLAHELRQELEPVHAGHAHVAERHVHGLALDQGERRSAVPGRQHLVALRGEHQLQALAQGVVVVRDQDALAHGPSPSALIGPPGAAGEGSGTRGCARTCVSAICDPRHRASARARLKSP
jgi:hypothetical protein